jgi:hypothetical protein
MRCIILSCLFCLLVAISAYAEIDSIKQYTISDTLSAIDSTHFLLQNTNRPENNREIGKTGLFFKETGFSLLGGCGGIVSCLLLMPIVGFGGGGEEHMFDALLFAPLGYVAGSSLGTYFTAKHHKKQGNLPLILLSEAVSMGIVAFAWAKSYDLAMDNMSRENYLKYNHLIPTAGVTFSITLPVLSGIMVNNLTIKNKSNR